AAMPPYPEVKSALIKLRDAGYKLFTLTNNPLETAKSQLTRGGLLELFEDCFSIDGSVNVYKPAPQSYALVEQRLEAPPSALWLIACHDWDVLGAAARGWKAAMIERPGNARLPTGPQPDIVATTLSEFAEQLLRRD
ncbi:MAG: HAD hydrolase-like protein, partial [Caulobacteraceae bacterium]|nr:HAD hydrolase-like protein [Caulobacter sp.]